MVTKRVFWFVVILAGVILAGGCVPTRQWSGPSAPGWSDGAQATLEGVRSKLGGYSFAECKLENGNPIIIINAYTQYRYGRDTRNVDYRAIEKVMKRLKDWTHGRLGMPKIGCGLAGGEWSIVEEILNRVFDDREITVVEYNHKGF